MTKLDVISIRNYAEYFSNLRSYDDSKLLTNIANRLDALLSKASPSADVLLAERIKLVGEIVDKVEERLETENLTKDQFNTAQYIIGMIESFRNMIVANYNFTGKSNWKDIEKLKFSVKDVMDIAEEYNKQKGVTMEKDSIRTKEIRINYSNELNENEQKYIYTFTKTMASFEHIVSVDDNVVKAEVDCSLLGENVLLKKIEQLAKQISDEHTVDDDVSDGYLEEPYKSWVNELYYMVNKLDEHVEKEHTLDKNCWCKPTVEDHTGKQSNECKHEWEKCNAVKCNKCGMVIED